MMRHLLALPAELLSSILSYLDSRDLLSCAAVAKHLHRLISDSSKLQYTINLAKHRLLDILPMSSDPPYATRLRILRDRERAWRELDWKDRHTLHLPPTGSVYEFVGGIYGNGREDENRVTASISFLELPSSDPMHLGLPTRSLRTWTHAMGDVAIIDFTMDPSQNLLVLVALSPLDSKYIYDLHLRTISTNEPHPKAPLSTLSCLERYPTIPPPPELFAAVRVQVSGDLVGLLIKEAPESIGAHLEIWNWENEPHYSCSLSNVHGIDDFTFLSHSSFLVVLPTGKFEVYTFPDPLSSAYSNSSKNHCEPVRRYIYEFPELSDGYLYWYISMSCNPAPGYIPSQGGQALSPFPPPSPRPSSPDPLLTPDKTDADTETSLLSSESDKAAKQLYYPLPDERIHACCIYIFNPNNAIGNNNAGDDLDDDNQQVHSFVFFLNLKTLLEPPEEWFCRGEKMEQRPKVPSFHSSSSPFATLASKLGPLWKSPSASTSTTAIPITSKKVPVLAETDETTSTDCDPHTRSSVDVPVRVLDDFVDDVNDDYGLVHLPVARSTSPLIFATRTDITSSPPSPPLSLSSPVSPKYPLPSVTPSTYPPFPTFSSPYSTARGGSSSSQWRDGVMGGNSNATSSGNPSSGTAPSTPVPIPPPPSTLVSTSSPTSPIQRTHVFVSSATRSAFSLSTSPPTPSARSSSPSPSSPLSFTTPSTKLNHVKNKNRSHPNASTPIPWDVWGPSSTRWFEECLSTDWQHAIYGLRTVESVSMKERESEIARMEAEKRKLCVNGKGKGKHKACNGSEGWGNEEGMAQEPARCTRDGKGTGTRRKMNVGVQTGSDTDVMRGSAGNFSGSGAWTSEEGEENDDRLWLSGSDISPSTNRSGISNHTSGDGPSITITPTSNGINGASTNGHQAEPQMPGQPPPPTPPVRRGFLRVRDFNPYSLKLAEAEAEAEAAAEAYTSIGEDSIAASTKSKGKQRAVLFSPHSHPICLTINSDLGASQLKGLSFLPRSSSKSKHPDIAVLPVNGSPPTQTRIWGKRRVVREPSTTPVKGVFKRDIVSWLPYTEVVSEETFEVTDVMMDDCRLLLLKRGQMGKLESVEVLMM